MPTQEDPKSHEWVENQHVVGPQGAKPDKDNDPQQSTKRLHANGSNKVRAVYVDIYNIQNMVGDPMVPPVGKNK